MKDAGNKSERKETNMVLVTGGCGFIGVNLVNYFLRKGFTHIKILDNLSTGSKTNLEEVILSYGWKIAESKSGQTVYKPEKYSELSGGKDISQIELIIGDIRSYETCSSIMEDVETVIHLAAHAGVIPSVEDPIYDFEINVKGTLNLLHASVENDVDKFIFASSNAPLGNQNPPMDENKIPKPLSPYGASKLACEGYCSAFYKSYGLNTVSVRFSNVYGPYSMHKMSVVSKFIKDALVEKALTIYDDGTQTRDFINVADISEAMCKIMMIETKNSNSEKTHTNIWGEIFHLGTGKEVRIIDLARLITKMFEADVKIMFKPPRRGEIKRNFSDIHKAAHTFNYKPSVGLEKGLKETHSWFLRQRLDDIKNASLLSGSE
jgi:UDP-glucose 4-epimerase